MNDTPKTESLKDDMVDGWPDRWLASHADLERQLVAAQAKIADLQERLKKTNVHLNAAQGLATALMECGK